MIHNNVDLPTTTKMNPFQIQGLNIPLSGDKLVSEILDDRFVVIIKIIPKSTFYNGTERTQKVN